MQTLEEVTNFLKRDVELQNMKDEIKRLQADNKRLREQLKPYMEAEERLKEMGKVLQREKE